MPPLLLLTRPAPASHRFASESAHLGLETLISPILEIVAVAHDRSRLDAAEGLVITSENAVPFVAPGRGRPAICVGPRSAAVAQAAGFEAIAGPGDAARLMPMLEGLGAGWLHPHGTHVAKVLPVEGVAVYDQRALPLTPEARHALSGDRPVILPLFSPRSARLLAAEAGDASAPLWLVAISPAAASAWAEVAQAKAGAIPARLEVAATPDAPGILHKIAEMLGAEHS